MPLEKQEAKGLALFLHTQYFQLGKFSDEDADRYIAGIILQNTETEFDVALVRREFRSLCNDPGSTNRGEIQSGN